MRELITDATQRHSRQRRRKHAVAPKKYFFLLCTVIVFASITVVGFILRSPTPAGVFGAAETAEPILPDEVLQRYFSYIESGQFKQMYNLLDSMTQEQISQGDFVERNRNIYEGIGARNIMVTINEMNDVPARPGRKIVSYTLQMDTVAGEISHDGLAIFQLNSDNEYRLQWTSNMIFPGLGENDRVRVRILPAERGRIFDRNGEMLAGPGTASAVGFVPGRMRREEVPAQTFVYNEEDIARVAALLEMTPEAVLRRLNASYVRDDVFVQLRIISRDAQELIDELLTIQGILISTAHVRYYPLGRSAAHLVGYIQNINAEELESRRDYGYHMNSVIGRAGLERIYEDVLRARDGREIFIVDSEGNRTTTLARLSPQNG